MKIAFNLNGGLKIILTLSFSFLISVIAQADVIHLKNGDRITGDVVEEEKDKISVKTSAMGTIKISRGLIERIECVDIIYLKNDDRISGKVIGQTETEVSIKTDTLGVISVKKDNVKEITSGIKDRLVRKQKELPKVVWTREISAGYNFSRGNVKTEEIYANVFVNRNIKHVDEVTGKANIYYSESDREMNAQRWYGLGRYAYSFGKSKKWYNFYRVEADHNRFANIDYRIIPATGVGYWIFEEPDTKLLAELGVGWEHTAYRDEDKDLDEGVLTPRVCFEKSIFDRAKIAEDFYMYPSLRHFGEYRLRSESSLTCDINDKCALRFSLIDEYDSTPKGDTKKNDIRFISSVVASF